MKVWTLHIIAILALVINFTLSIEVRVLTGLNMRGQTNQPDYGDQKLVINSNNRYIYPSQQTPEYNVYSIPTLLYHRNFLEVVSDNFIYPILIIDQKSSGPTSYQLVHPFTREIMESINEPIYLKPFQKMHFLTEEKPFNIASFLFSGTGLFIIGGIFLYMCYSKLMPSLQEAQMAPESAQSSTQ